MKGQGRGKASSESVSIEWGYHTIMDGAYLVIRDFLFFFSSFFFLPLLLPLLLNTSYDCMTTEGFCIKTEGDWK